MPKECKHCHGRGQVTPVVTMECPFCRNLPNEKSNCYECYQTGMVRREVCEMCEICYGTGQTK